MWPELLVTAPSTGYIPHSCDAKLAAQHIALQHSFHFMHLGESLPNINRCLQDLDLASEVELAQGVNYCIAGDDHTPENHHVSTQLPTLSTKGSSDRAQASSLSREWGGPSLSMYHTLKRGKHQINPQSYNFLLLIFPFGHNKPCSHCD